MIIRQPEREHMGKKDIADRSFFADRERFAELINQHLYQGEQIVLPLNLEQKEIRYPSLTSSGGEMSRDILMEDMSRRIRYGLEIETESDYSMPERVMTYDSCEYEQQIKEIHRAHLDRKEYKGYREKKSRMKKSDFLYPTVTVVLYLGEGHWRGRKRLSDLFQITDRDRNLLERNLQDYAFPLIEADYVNYEDYQTDLKEFFQAMQYRQDRAKLRQMFFSENFVNLQPETEQVIAAHLQVKQLIQKMRKEELPMCRAFNELMKEERQNGRREGKREEKSSIVRRMIQEGMAEELIIKIAECTREELAVLTGR